MNSDPKKKSIHQENSSKQLSSFLDIENISGLNFEENAFETQEVNLNLKRESNKYNEMFSNRVDKFNLITLEKIENLEKNFENLENLEKLDHKYEDFESLINQGKKALLEKFKSSSNNTNNINNIQNTCNNYFDNKNLNVFVINNIHTNNIENTTPK